MAFGLSWKLGLGLELDTDTDSRIILTRFSRLGIRLQRF